MENTYHSNPEPDNIYDGPSDDELKRIEDELAKYMDRWGPKMIDALLWLIGYLWQYPDAVLSGNWRNFTIITSDGWYITLDVLHCQ